MSIQIVGLYLNHCRSSFQRHLNCSKNIKNLSFATSNAFALALFRTTSIRSLRTIQSEYFVERSEWCVERLQTNTLWITFADLT
jgi:hypothetical protein